MSEQLDTKGKLDDQGVLHFTTNKIPLTSAFTYSTHTFRIKVLLL